MIILATLDQLNKKKMNKYMKVIVSDRVSEDDLYGYDDCILSREFLPDPVIFTNYISGYISKKKYREQYVEEILDNDTVMASVIMMAIYYRKGGKLALVCDESEVDFKYLEFLAKFMSARYGIRIGTYKNLKTDKKIKNKMDDEKRLEKDIKKYRKVLKETANYSEGKKKKKKDKSKDKKKKKKKSKDLEPQFTCYTNSKDMSGFDSRVKIVSTKKLFKKLN